MRRIIVGFLAIAIAMPFAWAEPEEQAAAPCPDVRWDNGVALCPTGDGHFLIYDANGQPQGYTHGSDPLSLLGDEGPIAIAGGSDVECVPGTAGTFYIRVIYARAYDDADNYASSVSLIRNMVAGAQQLVNDAAAATANGVASLKVKCAGGLVVVENAVLSTPKASATYSTVFADLEALGYTDARVKHWVWYDDTGACTCAGIAHFYKDDSPGVSNYNNGNGADTMFAVTFGYNSVRTMLHELSHNMGAVQDSAPHSTQAGHCYDGRDTLCYNDGGPQAWRYSTSYCSVEVYDCGRDDYFHLSPAPGSYLATHWNIGHINNRYMAIYRNLPPTMTSVSCTPTSAALGATFTCDFSATDTANNLSYTISWGDGAIERVPATGFVPSGATGSASRVYETDNTFTVSVTAVDDHATPQTSTPMTRSLTAQAAPIMRTISCAPAPAETQQSVTCSFRATDNSSGLHYMVDWADGSALQRVPASGTVAPGTSASATHAWAAPGSYTITATATDNGAPALTSAPLSSALAVDPNQAPVMTSVSCAPDPVQAENPVTCSFQAADRSALYYLLDWGDGTPPQRVPASGTVAPGTTQQASRTFMTSGDRIVAVSATDSGSPVMTSAVLSTTARVTPPNVAPAMASASCSAAGATMPMTCTFRATDSDSSGVRYRIEWGDGTVSFAPASSYAGAGASHSVTRAYAKAGTYALNVTATDDGSPAKTSGVLSIAVNVSADNVGPAMSVQEPLPHFAYMGCGIVQNVVAGDAVYVSRGCVRASAYDSAGVANVTVLVDGVVVAVDTTAPYLLDFAVPRGMLDARVDVIAYDNLGNGRTITLKVDIL